MDFYSLFLMEAISIRELVNTSLLFRCGISAEEISVWISRTWVFRLRDVF